MDGLMEVLFNYATEHLLGKYYGQTNYAERRAAQDEIGRKLWEQLPPEQRLELEAMFLAAFDQCKSLAQSHCA